MTSEQLILERRKSKPSVGEKRVVKYLRKSHIDFKREYTFEGLKNPQTGYPLFFDFYCKKLNLAIEVDGSQHFRPKNGDEKAFKSQVNRDRVKNRFCKKNNISLCRLTYGDLKTFDKLTKYISDCLHDKKPCRAKEAKKVKYKPLKRFKPKESDKERRAKAVGNRIRKNEAAREIELQKRREEARLNYPEDIRIYLAQKYKSDEERERTSEECD